MAPRLMDNRVRHIKFPLFYDAARLQAEVSNILGIDWIPHYNKAGYQGNWNSVSLLSADGKSSNIHAVYVPEQMIATEILPQCPYIREILDAMAFKKTAVRLLRLEAGAEVKPHTDNCLGYEDGSFRLHIPVITNPEVEFLLDGERIVMNEGECWYINANFTHSVANRGTQDRIHLVIDGERNDWSDGLFLKDHEENQFVKPQFKIKDSEKDLMIAALQQINTPAALSIIAKLQAG